MDEKIKGLLSKYQPLKERYLELSELLCSPEIIADNRLYLRLGGEKQSLEESYHLGEALSVAIELNDEEETRALYSCLMGEMLPKGKLDKRSAIMELREDSPQSKPLVEELLKIYTAYTNRLGYHLNVIEREEKFTSVSIEGVGAYENFRFETGAHRSTQKGLNATVWVAVLPQMDDVTVAIKDGDIRTDIFHSSGAGGQNINKVATAVRLTHLPTGIVVTSQEERSQLRNRERAKTVLLSRVYDFYREKELTASLRERASILKKARTERVRLIDFENEKITDLRTGHIASLKSIYQGNLNELIEGVMIKEERK